MICLSCKHENPDGAKFCLQCGNAFASGCNYCGSKLPPSAKFCGQCGAAVATQNSQNIQDVAEKVLTVDSQSQRSPRDYTPKHLADKILQSKSALEGERKQVTVLFADVKGSMDLAGQLDPEDWHKILDRFFAVLGEGVHRFEGTINQYTGDGIMALFGALGLGKSRLLRKFSRYVKEMDGGYVITTHNPSHSKEVPCPASWRPCATSFVSTCGIRLTLLAKKSKKGLLNPFRRAWSFVHSYAIF